MPANAGEEPVPWLAFTVLRLFLDDLTRQQPSRLP